MKQKDKVRVFAPDTELVEATNYMLGLDDYKLAEKNLQNGEYTKEELYRAVAWYRADGLHPFTEKKEWAEGKGLDLAIADYKNKLNF